MPKLTPTLWIFNAVTLPIVGLVIALTPKAPIATNNSSSQPVVAPDAKSSLKKPDQAKELLPSSAKEPVSAPSVQPVAPDIKPLPKKIKSTFARPARPIASVTSPPIAPRQVVAASNTFSLSSPTKSQPAFRLSSQPLISLRPPQRVVSTPPFVVPEAEPPLKMPEATVIPSPQAITLPSPPEELPTPTLPFSTREVSPVPERKPSPQEVQSLCQKFPLNSRCQDTRPFATLEALLAPERKPSLQEVQSLCQKFPLNSRCNNNTSPPDTSAPAQRATTPQPNSSSPAPSTTPPDSNLLDATSPDSSSPTQERP